MAPFSLPSSIPTSTLRPATGAPLVPHWCLSPSGAPHHSSIQRRCFGPDAVNLAFKVALVWIGRDPKLWRQMGGAAMPTLSAQRLGCGLLTLDPQPLSRDNLQLPAEENQAQSFPLPPHLPGAQAAQ